MATQEHRPLDVIIAGAGIGGLSAAIGLRQAGHNVQLFESSRFAMELGAAIHVAPNVLNVLERFGVRPSEFGANNAEWVSVYDNQGKIINQKSIQGLEKIYGHPWQLCHRVDLHEALKEKATSTEGPGRPAKLHLRQRVVACDPASASITLESGEKVSGDVLIAADGVNSRLRNTITGRSAHTFSSGGSAFRFLVPIKDIKADNRVAHLVEKNGELQLREGNHRRLVIYPCRNNTELNFVCLHPDNESRETGEGWNNTATVEDVLRVYEEYGDDVKTLLGMADPSTIKLWQLLDCDALETWVSGKSALLGDAAHPFLPHQGQGGAQAIEDGAALAALLPAGTPPAEVPARLELYMKSRYDRATLVQNFSRQMAFKTSAEDKVGGHSMNPMEFSKINFAHDAFLHAQGILEQSIEPSPSAAPAAAVPQMVTA